MTAPHIRSNRFYSNREDAMIVSFREPTLKEILSDPVTKAVMRADGVEAGEIEAMLRDIAERGLRRREPCSAC
jgi:hypothetical protein